MAENLDSGIIFESNLQKKGKKFKRWVTRWFVLMDNGDLLSCKKKGKKFVDVKTVLSVPAANTSDGSKFNCTKMNDGSNCVFRIVEATAVIHDLKASTETDRDLWIDHISKLQESLSSHPPSSAKISQDGKSIVMSHSAESKSKSNSAVTSPSSAEAANEDDFSYFPASQLSQMMNGSKAGGVLSSSLQIDCFTMEQQNQRTWSVLETIQNRLTACLKNSVHEFGKAVLILDDISIAYIDAILRMSDITAQGISLVMNLSKNNRRRQAGFTEIFIISPESVDALTDHLAPLPKSDDETFLFFTSTPNDEQHEKLCKSKPIVETLKHNNPSVLNVDFSAIDDQIIHLNEPNAQVDMYSFEISPAANESRKRIAKKLASLILALNEFPHVRYDFTNPKASHFAFMVEEEYQSLFRKDSHGWFHGMMDAKDRATVLLLERVDDLASPLVHDFSYESMLHDLMDFDKLNVRYEDDAGKTHSVKQAQLMKNNDYWKNLRHLHVADCISNVQTTSKELQDSRPAMLERKMRSEHSRTISAHETSEALHGMADHRRRKMGLAAHIDVLNGISSLLSSRRVIEAAEIEMSMVTQVRSGGKEATVDYMEDTIRRQLATLKPEDQSRILALYALFMLEHGKVRQAEEIVNRARISDQDKLAINNILKAAIDRDEHLKGCLSMIPKLAVPYSKLLHAVHQNHTEMAKQVKDKRDKASRFHCRLHVILEKLLSKDEHDKKELFPFTTEAGHTTISHRADSKRRPRLIVFLPGATYMEAKVVYELSEKYNVEIVLVTTKLQTPKEFLKDMSRLSESSA
eukprot:TRINITY_DN2159_c0_g1_i2.p1 TRINITY_DN2159_c0_g1~~TRINITY_DN2159_c0_g1_i2.p1  ORF type:complete len:805 (-),score=226.74 TRINITY_DN2159_c0_g1_i2:80-2494(-)